MPPIRTTESILCERLDAAVLLGLADLEQALSHAARWGVAPEHLLFEAEDDEDAGWPAGPPRSWQP